MVEEGLLQALSTTIVSLLRLAPKLFTVAVLLLRATASSIIVAIDLYVSRRLDAFLDTTVIFIIFDS